MSVRVTEFYTGAVYISDYVKHSVGKRHHASTVLTQFSPLRFIKDPRCLKVE